jgi:hypothetical protein
MGRIGMAHLTHPLSSAPKSLFLSDTLAALAKRRRAIRHKTRGLAVDKVLERTGAEEQEKLEISAEVGAARLRLFVWDDRWVFIDARIPTKTSGWEWEFSYQGRLVGDDTRALFGGFEQSIDAVAAQSDEALDNVWRPLLAAGPRQTD